MSDEPEAPRPSIWQPLDGSAPPEPTAPTGPISFRKPDPIGNPTAAFATSPAHAAPVAAPGSGPVYTLAEWVSRLGAYAIDLCIFGLLPLLVAIPAGIALGMTVEEAGRFFTGSGEVPGAVSDPTLPWVIFALQALIQAFGPAIFLARWGGQTPGKRIAGIKVVTADGSPLTFLRALRRELLAKGVIIGLIAVVTLFIGFLLNYLWPLWDRENRAGHDVIAATRVVNVPKTPPRLPETP